MGKAIKVDDATSSVSKGLLYARVYMEGDLQKPLVSKFMLRRRVRRLEYEGIHLVCFVSGMYGHMRKLFEGTSERTSPPESREGNLANEGLVCQKMVNFSPEIVELYRPWMLATRRSRRNPANQKEKITDKIDKDNDGRTGIPKLSLKVINSQTRFNVLFSDDDKVIRPNHPKEPFEDTIDEIGPVIKKYRKEGLRMSRRPNVQAHVHGERGPLVDIALCVHPETEPNFRTESSRPIRNS